MRSPSRYIVWGLLSEHDEGPNISRPPKVGDYFFSEYLSEHALKITSVVDHDGQMWIFLENGGSEEVCDIFPIDAKN